MRIRPFAGTASASRAAYGWTLQTAYLKANYPLQYFAALMSSVRDKTDKLVEYIEEAKKMGIIVLPPDINESLVDFAVVEGQIRFGLAAVKGVGEGAVDAILAARARDGRFADLFEFVKRVETRMVNRKVYEALIKCGALDRLPGNRAQLLDAIEGALGIAARVATAWPPLLKRSRDAGAAHASEPPRTRRHGAGVEKETLGIFFRAPWPIAAAALARTASFATARTRYAPVRIASGRCAALDQAKRRCWSRRSRT